MINYYLFWEEGAAGIICMLGLLRIVKSGALIMQQIILQLELSYREMWHSYYGIFNFFLKEM